MKNVRAKYSKNYDELRSLINKAYIKLANCRDYEKKEILFKEYRTLMDEYAERKQWIRML